MRSRFLPVGRRPVRLGLVTAVTVAALGLFAAPAFASLLPTTTVLSSSAATVNSTGSVKITATVNPGLLITAYGSVAFADASTSTSLGTVKPSSLCLLFLAPCSVSISVPGSDLAAGPNRITGSYSGNLLQSPSTGAVTIDEVTVTTCTSEDASCVTPTVTSADGSADGSITTAGPSSGTETISISFQTQELDCSTPASGDPIVFSATNAGGQKFVQYDVYGTAANNADTAYNNAIAGQQPGWVCYESAASFTTDTGAGAQLGSDGLYYGILPYCASSSIATDPPNVPCFTGASYQSTSGDGGPPEFTDYFAVSQSDPRASN